MPGGTEALITSALSVALITARLSVALITVALSVMAGFVPAIYPHCVCADGRDEPGHDGQGGGGDLQAANRAGAAT